MAAGRGWERAKRCEYYIRDKRAAVLPFIQFLVFISGTSPMGMRWGSLEPLEITVASRSGYTPRLQSGLV